MRNKKYFFNRILLSMAVVCSWSAILNSHNAFAQTYSLKLSYSSNRSNPVSLTNQKVAGNIYVFTSPDTNVKQVKFYINKPAGSGTPYMTENLLPFDLAGTATNGTANAYDSLKLPEGSNSISAIITLKDSTTVSLQSFFTVDNVPDTQCGNGIVEAGEECEGSTTQACTINGYSGLKTCSSCHYGSCVATQYCGDGIKNGTEGCDDGNTANGDGCSSTCTVETPPISYNLMLSSSANRSNPVLLSNKTVAGNIYVYTSPDTNVKQVSFYINKPAGSGTPDKIEGLPPFDLAGTATDGTANPFNSASLSEGANTIAAIITFTNYSTVTIEASFTVNNVPDAPAAMLFIRDIQYSPSGQVTRAVYGNGDVEVYTYNPLNLRLTRKVTTNALGQSLQDFEYIYDNTGNIVQIIDHVHSANQNFQYDELSRLTRAEGTDALGYGVKNFSFDEIGNLIAKDGKFYYYDNTGNAGPHAVTGLSDGTTFTYDANGNLASKSEAGSLTEYSYDIENRLTQVKKNAAVIATYQYDGDGGRTKKTAVNPTTQQTQTTTYVGSLYEEIDGQKIAYVMLGNMVVGSLRDGKMLYYHTDHLGSTNVVTDAQGAVKELTEYQPFGTEGRHEKYGTSDEVALYYFTGKPKDDETGLYYYGARYYNPSLGRFITPDTIIEDPANPQSLNRYSYVLNNPINRIDPTGHWSWKKFWNSFAGAVVGAVVTVATGGLGTPLAFALGGMTGGAITGGLEGGWKGALMGGLMGGALGGGVGLGVSAWGSGFGYAALAAGGGYAIGTGHADSFVGGLAGGVLGGSMADGYLSAKNDGLSERGPTEGIRAWVSADDNENWAFLGINTTDKGAQAFANENQMTVIYSKSHGLLSDLFRAGFKKLGVSGPYARQSANYLNVAEGKFILPYSEGTLNLGSGIKLAAANGIKFQNLEIKWIGPVISRSTAMSLSNSIRAQSSYYLNFGDPVGALTTMNPVRMGIYGGVGLATFAIFHGENYYVQ